MDYGQICLDDKRIFTSPKSHVDRKIIVEEIFTNSNANTTLIRKITCHEFSGDFRRRQNHQLEILHRAPDFNTEDKHVKIMEVAEEPMDVDSSSDRLYPTPRLRNLNFNKPATRFYETDETVSTLMPIDDASFSGFTVLLSIFILLFVLVGIYIVIVGDRFVYVNKQLQLENIKSDLQKSVLSQERAVEIIIRSFEQMEAWKDPIKILPFIGSTGVGKTFTINRIKRHFFPYLVHELNAKHLSDTSEQQYILENLNSCCCNLIIIDDLRAGDTGSLLSFVEKLPRSQNLLIVPIFNIQGTTDGVNFKINKNDYKFIRDEMDKSELFHELVLFDTLERQAVEAWVRDELRKRKVEVGKHDSIVKNLLDDEHVKYRGFKGLDAKLKLAVDS